jgi:uncharacterized protein (TIGR00730 family)
VSTGFTVCVYCGSRAGARPDYERAARELGAAIGAGGAALVYGGGNVGLMGVVADAALAAGARVTGVIPRALMQREVGHGGLTEQLVVATMHERKQAMAERADAFVALPGGIGTLEELFEAWTWHQLGFHDKPIGLLNVAGYYDELLAFMDRCVGEGFLAPAQRRLLHVAGDPAALLARLRAAAQRADAPDDYRGI